MNKQDEYTMLFETGERDGYKKREKRVPPASFLKGLLRGSKFLEWRTKTYNQGYFAGRNNLEKEKKAANQLKQNDATKDMVFRIHYQQAYSRTLIGEPVVIPQKSEYKVKILQITHFEALHKGINQAKIDRERIKGINHENKKQLDR